MGDDASIFVDVHATQTVKFFWGVSLSVKRVSDVWVFETFK